ncbi:MAG: LPS export ABC transporter ATP-binding protein [Desulfobacterales bacterium]|jgi:lipopolysaccharide export system ATP-binding protein|nr:LPS export ABC transporter ATP-binding protein [Desulfobacterales bacterium]
MTSLVLKDLVKIYDGRRVVDSVNIEINSGEVVGLLGPNGAGKTTTFYMTVGMIKPDNGNVYIDQEEITEYPMFRRARKGVGYLPQEPSVFRKLSVKNNLMAILETLPISKREQHLKADSLLAELGIGHLSQQKAAVLSGGERRRLEITRALATDPSFILLDEPFAGIDPLAIIDIQNIIIHLAKRHIGVLISDHNVRETLGVCEKAYILNNGQVIESGSPETIARSPVARQIYLGMKFKL